MGKLLVQDRPLVRAKSDIDVVQKMRETNTSYLIIEKKLFTWKLFKGSNKHIFQIQRLHVCVFSIPMLYPFFITA